MTNEDTLTVMSKDESVDNYTLERDKHILVALDETENSKRALLYVANFLGGQSGIRATLIRIIPEPSEDIFEDNSGRAEWIEDQFYKSTAMLKNYRDVLIQSGFEGDKIVIKVIIINCTSIAESILEEQKKNRCCTVVVGRRAISRKEEFLFGSTTNRILHTDKKCALWVIE